MMSSIKFDVVTNAVVSTIVKLGSASFVTCVLLYRLQRRGTAPTASQLSTFFTLEEAYLNVNESSSSSAIDLRLLTSTGLYSGLFSHPLCLTSGTHSLFLENLAHDRLEKSKMYIAFLHHTGRI